MPRYFDASGLSTGFRSSDPRDKVAGVSAGHPIVAVDWSLREVHVTYDGWAVKRLPSVHDLIDELDSPHRIVAESTIESWDPDRRAALARRATDEGHELVVFRPIHTARLRNELGLEKSHEEDARVIYKIATGGTTHLYPILTPDIKWAQFRTEANREYQRLRLSGEKAALAEQATAILGPYKDLDADEQLVLGNGKTYLETALAAVYFAAQHASSRKTFERLLGLHGSAYPSLLRSEVHHHGFRHAKKRGVTWTLYRRQLRRLYARFKEHREKPASQ